MSRISRSRRSVLKSLGAGLGGTVILSGRAGASQHEWFPPMDDRTRWGEAFVVEEGIIQTFLRVKQNGDPQQIGFYVMAWAFDDLSAGYPHVGTHLSLPDGSVYDVARFDWNPHGHEPHGIYDLPHLDFHFYTIPESQVKSIKPGPAMYSIPSNRIPEGYVREDLIDTDGDGKPDAPAKAPAMGEHLLNPSSPEFQGETFTHTHIYGAWNPDGGDTGQLIFNEPMMTKAFLQQMDQEVRTSIGMPSEFAESGMYPTEYVIRHHPDQRGDYTVTLESFEQF